LKGDAYLSKSSKKLFNDLEIYTERELEARHEIRLENYTMKVQIESRILEELIINQIMPVAVRYQTEIFSNLQNAKAAGLSNLTSTSLDLAKSLASHIDGLRTEVLAMRKAC